MEAKLAPITLPPPDIYRSTLYDITGALAQALAAMDQIMGDDSLDDDQKATALELAQAEFVANAEALPGKIDNCCKYIRSEEADIAALDAEIIRLKFIRDAREAKVKRFRDSYMLACLKMAEGCKIKMVDATAYIQKSEAVEIVDPEALPSPRSMPDIWTVHEPTINKTAIKARLKAGEVISGAAIATSEHVVIRNR